MDIEYGTEVVDKNGVLLGQVEHVVRNAWTGEISKFVVRRDRPGQELFFSPRDVLGTTESEIKVNASDKEIGASPES